MRFWVSGLAAMLLAMPVLSASAPALDEVFVTLGTGGGPLPRTRRSGPANALVVGNDIYLFDVGPGTVRQLAAAGLANHRLRAIFLSHHHVDHIGDLSPLLGTRWVLKQAGSVPVYGPPGTRTLVAATLKPLTLLETVPVTIGAAAKQPPITEAALGYDIPKAADPILVYQDDKVRVEAIDVAHFHLDRPRQGTMPHALALRITVGGRRITYSGDTGVSENLTRLAKGSDLLVAEVIDLDETRRVLSRTTRGDAQALEAIMAHMKQDHLTPAQVGQVAAAAKVKKVVLTHLVPGADGENDTGRYLRGISEFYPGPVVVAEDLDRF